MYGPEYSPMIRSLSVENGFDLIGIIKPFISGYKEILMDYVSRKASHEMLWLSGTMDKRIDITKVFEGLKSIISLATYYKVCIPQEETDDYACISSYSMINDYHSLLKKNAERFITSLEKLLKTSFRYRIMVDSGPVLEKEIAENAGIGFRGKNTLIINPHFGSHIFLTEILTDLDITFENQVITDSCANCDLCIRSCPTSAIKPYILDASKCISYLTVEYKGIIDDQLKEKMRNMISGCDICQQVCPYNRSIPLTIHSKRDKTNFGFHINERLINAGLLQLVQIRQDDFGQIFRDSPVIRMGYKRFIRNILISMGNTGNPAYKGLIENFCSDPDEIIRDAALYALKKTGKGNGADEARTRDLRRDRPAF